MKVTDRRKEMFGPTYLCFILSHIMKVEFYFTGKTKCTRVWRWTSAFQTMSAEEKVDMVCLVMLSFSPGHYKKLLNR